MIKYQLKCKNDHTFEGWFASSADFTAQAGRGLVSCPVCGSVEIGKAPMAPRVPRKGNQLVAAPTKAPAPTPEAPATAVAGGTLPPEAAQMMQALVTLQQQMVANSRWVGDRFAEDARAMHYGDKPAAPIHGRASREEAESLSEEGIAVAPLPFPVVPPEETH